MGHIAKECLKKKAGLKRKKEANEVDPKSDSSNVTIGKLFLIEYCFAYVAIVRE